jgi:hypothetical protein
MTRNSSNAGDENGASLETGIEAILSPNPIATEENSSPLIITSISGEEFDADLSVSVLASISESVTESGISKATASARSMGRPMSAIGRRSTNGNGGSLSISGRSMSAVTRSSGDSVSSGDSATGPQRFSSVGSSSTSSSSNSPRRSSRKLLTDFIASDASNRCCADCQCILIDFTKMYCSFYDVRANVVDGINNIDFAECHGMFKPPSPQRHGNHMRVHRSTATALRRENRSSKKHRDALSSIAHAVFVCSMCSTAHKALGTKITTVKSITIDQWSHNDVHVIKQAGGNARSNLILEAYLKDGYRPDGNSGKETREVFVRAKYQTLAFLLPRGPLNVSLPLLSLSHTNGNREMGSKNATSSKNGHSQDNSNHVEEELPNRLVDYFCIVSSNGILEKESHSYLSSCRSPSELCFEAQVTYCYPNKNAYGKSSFPDHLPKFVFPQGCRPTKSQTPTLFTFTLTNECGTKIYCAALHIYETHLDVEKILEYIRRSDYRGPLPSWLQTFEQSRGKGNKSKSVPLAGQDSDLLFLPKCLVVLSHYGFFDVWRKFLLQIYHISMVKAPLPLERYIANFVSEVPLPPQGRIAVRVAFANDEIVSISRPPINRLPLVNFSYRPLFACLSISNVMVVMGCLLQESRVALFSKHCSLLGPCCEALTSLLFPLVWQGIYIPVLPASLTVDLLEAPIPFLVGTHRIYLDEFPIDKRPKGVTLVDLDNDVVHLGFDEDGDRRFPPFLPGNDAAKLKLQLEKYADDEFIVPDSHKKGMLTYGSNSSLPNEERALYCRMTDATYKETRSKHLEQSEFAFMENKHLMPIEFSGGTLTEGGGDSINNQFKMKGMKTNKKSKVSLDDAWHQERHLLDIESSNESFNSSEIRNAFLRFMVALLEGYDTHISHNAQSDGELPSFSKDKFLCSCSADAKYFLSALMDSQMFERFIFRRIYQPDDPSVRFFDDSIQAKKNRSKISMGRRKETKFISDQKYNVVETFTPPEPNSQGIYDSVFVYNEFPNKLDSALSVNIRKSDLNGAKKVGKHAKVPGSSSLKTSLALKQQVMADLLRPSSTEPQSADYTYIEKDTNWALHAITLQLSKEGGKGSQNAVSFDPLEKARTILDDTRLRQIWNIVNITVFQKFWISHRIFPKHQLNPEGDRGSQLRSSWMRPVAMTSRWSMLKAGITVIQSFYRSRRVRRIYKSTILLIAKIQNFIRGYQTRKKVLQVVMNRVSDYRLQIGLLWKRANVSLIYRSRFVLMNNIPTFLAYAILEKELHDLYERLGIIYASASQDEDSLVAKSSIHSTFLAVQSQLDSVSIDEDLFPAELDKNSEHAIQILEASVHIQLERVSLQRQYGCICMSYFLTSALRKAQIYERVNAHPRQNEIYSILNIDFKEKKKKLNVAISVWKSSSEESSSTVILSLFPELVRSPNITAVVPSKKALTRFGLSTKNSIPLPLERSMQFEWKLDYIVRKDLGTITKGLLEISSRSTFHSYSSASESKVDIITLPATRNIREFVQSGIV